MPTVNDPNGNPQAVSDNGFALSYGASLSMAAHAADEGNAYTVMVDVDPAGSDQDFFYIKNSSDMYLRIYKIVAYCTADVELSIIVGVTGTPDTPSTLTPVNCLVGSGNTADGTFNSRAGDLAMTGGSTIDTLFIDTSESQWCERVYSSEIALMKNQTFAINNVTDPNAAIPITVYFYYHEKVERP